MNDLKSELMAMESQNQADLADSLKEINDLANQAYAAKIEASNAEAKAKEFKNKLTGLMETAGVDKISAQDCTVSGKMKTSASVPKDLSLKLELFAYIMSQDHNGVVSHATKEILEALQNYPTLLSMLTINATSFNSWHNQEIEKEITKGNVDFKLSMVSSYEYYSVGFRKKAKKWESKKVTNVLGVKNGQGFATHSLKNG